jgi:hypothetical protein
MVLAQAEVAVLAVIPQAEMGSILSMVGMFTVDLVAVDQTQPIGAVAVDLEDEQ